MIPPLPIPSLRAPIGTARLAGAAIACIAHAGILRAQPAQSAGAEPQGDTRYITDDLAWHTGTLAELTEESLTIQDAQGRSTRLPLERVIALSESRLAPGVLPTPHEAWSDAWFIELTDGQRLLARVLPTTDPDALTLDAFGLGRARVPIERVRRVARPGAVWDAPTPDADTATLANGDRITGFIASIGDTIDIETDAGVSAVPLARVSELRLANPSQPLSGLFVTDSLGVVLRAVALRASASGSLSVETEPGPLGVESGGSDTADYHPSPSRLAGFRWVADPARVEPIGRGPESYEPTGGRRWTPAPVPVAAEDPVLDLPGWRLPAPARVTFALPEDADRFACDLVGDAGRWSDCVVRLVARSPSGEPVTLFERRLSRDDPAATVACDLPSGARSIELIVDPGSLGPIQDGVSMLRPRVRVAR